MLIGKRKMENKRIQMQLVGCSFWGGWFWVGRLDVSLVVVRRRRSGFVEYNVMFRGKS